MPGAVRIGDPDNKGNTNIVGSTTVFIDDRGPPSASFISGNQLKSVGGVLIVSDQLSAQNRAKLTEDPDVGVDIAANDSFEEQAIPPAPIPDIAKAENNSVQDTKTPPTSCKLFKEPVDYSFQLSTNFTLKNLTVGCLYPHEVVAQRGLSIGEIVCNLQALAENILEPLKAQFPTGIRVNSAFRQQQNGRSQHETGQACDIQWAGATDDELWERVQWCKANLNYDQLGYEYGNRPWIHISFNRAGNRPATADKKTFTMKGGYYSSGLKRY